MSAYNTLEKIYKKLGDIASARSLLHWDAATQMPATGNDARIEQCATLDSLYHAIIADADIASLIEEAETESDWQKANLEAMKHMHFHAASVPSDLLKAFSKATGECEWRWRRAKQENDFMIVVPYLKEVVSLVRQKAKIKSSALNLTPYEALVDEFDPGIREKTLEHVFTNLGEWLPDFVEEVLAHQATQKYTKLPYKYDKEKQIIFIQELVEQIGLSAESSRIDETLHPFCTGQGKDVRIAIRYEDHILDSLMAALHESGHAIYEMQLPQKWYNQPVGQAKGMVIHESQSLLFEMQMGRSEAFLSYLLPILKKVSLGKGKAWELKNLIANAQRVERSPIRVHADEVTYPLHIMVRYQIEKYLVAGEMEVEDLPEAWSQGMQKFLHLTPTNDAEGCLQDIHWMEGAFGYFPSYSLGAIASAQFYKAAKESDTSIEDNLRVGNTKPLLDWLKKQVHDVASSIPVESLLKKATGIEGFDVDGYKHYLKERYLAN